MTGAARTAFAIAAVALVLCGAPGPARGDALSETAALRASQAAIGHVLADEALTDQYGRPFRLADLRGRPMVLNFVFTNCYYVCAGLTLHLREVVRVARDALGDERFSVLSIGFDAAHDNPASMREFARARGIDDPDWRFASADAATIRRLTDAAGFSWAPSSAGFDHVTQVTLVDANGRILQQVYGPDFAPPALVEPLKSLVLDQSFDRSMARGLIDSVKLFCSAYDPASGRYRFDFGMFAGSAPALLVFGMAALAILFLSRKTR